MSMENVSTNRDCKLSKKNNVTIPPNTDLNNLLDISDNTDQIEQLEEKKREFPKFKNLPPLIQDFLDIFLEPKEKEIALVSLLAGLSSILRNCVGKYSAKTVYPNLFTFIVGNFASGKGTMTFVNRLLAPIHKILLEQADEDRKRFSKEKAVFDRDLALFKKGKLDEPPTFPKLPKNTLLFVPGNSTKPALIKNLQDNPHGILLFDTEADAMSQNQKFDHGNYSDILRKGFHNEPCGTNRSTDNVYIEIPYTNISVLLSSTFDQLATLIHTVSNGLFSRGIYYTVSMDKMFHNVFDGRKDQYEEKVDILSSRVTRMFETLSKRQNNITVKLALEQDLKFHHYYQGVKSDVIENLGADYAGVVHRQALMAYKIAMIFTIARNYEENKLMDNLICSKDDFDNAMLLVTTLHKHTLYIYDMMPKSKVQNKPSQKERSLEEDLILRKKARELRAQGQSYRQISLELLGTDGKKSTVYRWLN